MSNPIGLKETNTSAHAFDPDEITHWEQMRPREISPEQRTKFEGYAAEIFKAFGMNVHTP